MTRRANREGGMICPHCGQPRTDHDGAEVLCCAAVEAADDSVRAMFRRFAAMEGQHMEALARRRAAAPPAAGELARPGRAATHGHRQAAAKEAGRVPDGRTR